MITGLKYASAEDEQEDKSFQEDCAWEGTVDSGDEEWSAESVEERHQYKKIVDKKTSEESGG